MLVLARYCLFFTFLLLNQIILAEEIELIGTQQYSITLAGPSQNKEISLPEYAIPPGLQSELYQRARHYLNPSFLRRLNVSADFPEKKQLGMSGVPVLDQGAHGSCAIFAHTAAIDAALNKGNYISQLCLLQLGHYLEQTKEEKSGWQGMSADVLLKRIKRYGIISIKRQYEHGCGGITSYPYFSTPPTSMTPEEYEQYHELIFKNNITWRWLFHHSDFTKIDKLYQIKMTLNKGMRIVIGVWLPGKKQGIVGAVATHHFYHDTWILTDKIVEHLQYADKLPGHEMIVTGYDDNARARDNTGKIHKGLLTLRNSWGWYMGDLGDFYMSYDYFNAMARHGIVFSKMNAD